MKPLNAFAASSVRYLFTDIDDTLTKEGQLYANAYQSLWDLQQSGIRVIPVTGRPAGWCEMIARFWPVEGIVGENGAFYFRYRDKKMHRHFFTDESTRLANRQKLDVIAKEILQSVPGSAIASDQFSRLMDLAIDFCEDVPALSSSSVKQIVSIFETHGAVAKISSIHVNGWFGNYDKLSMCKEFVTRELNKDLDKDKSEFAFSGDSPNDEPMFAFFTHSFAVANIAKFVTDLKHLPGFVAHGEGGDGFTEIAQTLIAAIATSRR